MEQEENILGKEKISKLIKKFSIPCIISLLVNSLYNIVDQIFIGQGVGYLGNGATNVVFPLGEKIARQRKIHETSLKRGTKSM